MAFTVVTTPVRGNCTSCMLQNVLLKLRDPDMCGRCVHEMDEENEEENQADRLFDEFAEI